MNDLYNIESAVRASGGKWGTLFHQTDDGWHCMLFPDTVLTAQEYAALSSRLSAASVVMSATDKARARARSQADRHG
jgi:hypothetical protein